jgi:hypothetical protein
MVSVRVRRSDKVNADLSGPFVDGIHHTARLMVAERGEIELGDEPPGLGNRLGGCGPGADRIGVCAGMGRRENRRQSPGHRRHGRRGGPQPNPFKKPCRHRGPEVRRAEREQYHNARRKGRTVSVPARR